MIYLKPSAGSRGVGILKVWRTESGGVTVKKTTLQPKSFKTPEAAWNYIDRQRENKAYIVQRGLHLAHMDGRPIDIRVMVQRTKPGGAWQYSGMLAKVAGKGSVVTNVALSRGSVMEVGPALMQALKWTQPKVVKTMEQLQKIALGAANHFDTYQKYRELGFDMAVDRNGKIWIIEENTGPSHALFKRLTSDLSMYQTIQRRSGQYWRARTNR